MKKKRIILLFSFFIFNFIIMCSCGTKKEIAKNENIQKNKRTLVSTTENTVQRKDKLSPTENQHDKENSNNKQTSIYNNTYNKFLKNGKWRKIYFNGSTVKIKTVNITSKKMVDIDSDGIPELWFIAKNSPNEDYGQQISGFCTIVDEQVKILTSGYISGGSMGGSWIDIRYDKQTSKHVVCLIGVIGGFTGRASWGEYYTYEEGVLSPLISLYQISQTKDLYSRKQLSDPSLFYIEEDFPLEFEGINEFITIYEVDEEQTTKEVYKKAKRRFVKPRNDEFILK